MPTSEEAAAKAAIRKERLAKAKRDYYYRNRDKVNMKCIQYYYRNREVEKQEALDRYIKRIVPPASQPLTETPIPDQPIVPLVFNLSVSFD